MTPFNFSHDTTIQDVSGESGDIAPRILNFGTGRKWPVSRPGRHTSRKRAARTPWMGPRAGLDSVAKGKNSFTASAGELDLDSNNI